MSCILIYLLENMALIYAHEVECIFSFPYFFPSAYQVELVSRIATVLLQTHYNQLVSTPAARPLLTTLKDILHKKVKVILPCSSVGVILQCHAWITSQYRYLCAKKGEHCIHSSWCCCKWTVLSFIHIHFQELEKLPRLGAELLLFWGSWLSAFL